MLGLVCRNRFLHVLVKRIQILILNHYRASNQLRSNNRQHFQNFGSPRHRNEGLSYGNTESWCGRYVCLMHCMHATISWYMQHRSEICLPICKLTHQSIALVQGIGVVAEVDGQDRQQEQRLQYRGAYSVHYLLHFCLALAMGSNKESMTSMTWILCATFQFASLPSSTHSFAEHRFLRGRQLSVVPVWLDWHKLVYYIDLFEPKQNQEFLSHGIVRQIQCDWKSPRSSSCRMHFAEDWFSD